MRRAVDQALGTRPAIIIEAKLKKTAIALEIAAVAHLQQKLSTPEVVIYVALFENGLRTEVSRGENSGKMLTNDFIVRRLEKLGSLRPSSESQATASGSLRVDSSWIRSNLGIVVFAQDSRTMRILGATRPD